MVSTDSALRGIQLVSSVLEQHVFPVVNQYKAHGEREVCLWGYFQRLFPVVRGLGFLGQPSFFQLTVAANRMLLEITVDVVHLAHRSPPDVAERIEAWEASAKLKAAEAAVAYLERTGATGDDLHRTFSSYVSTEGDQIRAERLRYWPPKGKHPERWTAQNLLMDSVAADKLEPFRLEHFYETHYRQMNWNIHASGFAGVRGLTVEGIDAIYSHSLLKSGDLAIKATTVILWGLGLLGPLQQRLEQLASDFGDVVHGSANPAAAADRKAPLSGR
jgi:hypothetical protein